MVPSVRAPVHTFAGRGDNIRVVIQPQVHRMDIVVETVLLLIHLLPGLAGVKAPHRAAFLYSAIDDLRIVRGQADVLDMAEVWRRRKRPHFGRRQRPELHALEPTFTPIKLLKTPVGSTPA